jgi:hypothetical protein
MGGNVSAQAIRVLFVAACVVTASLRLVHAQEAINFASVSGRVVDAQGGAIRDAQVRARRLETNASVETTTDAEGRFRFAYLSVGMYEVTAHRDGFRDSSRTLTATVGAAFDVTFTLAVAGIDTEVTVSGSTLLEAARSQIAGTVAAAEIENLPLNGRNFLDLALLIPGVSPTNAGSTQLFAETSAVPGQGLSIASQRNLSNSFVVDGLSANDDAAGLSGIPYGVDAVEQFQVVTSGAQAELGRALGGYVNVVTRSGTNDHHGTVYDFARDEALNADNALSGTRLPMNQQQFGGSLGGPLRRDRTFYFTNVERRLLDQSGLVTIDPANVQAINGRLQASGYPGALIATGEYSNPVHSTTALGRIDHHISGADQVSVRYSFYQVASDNSRGAGALSAASASAGLKNRDHSLAAGNTWTWSPRTVNETRVQFAHSDLLAPPTDPGGPAVSITGVATFGTLSTSPTQRVNRLFQVVDTVSHQAGAHALRAGVDVLVNDDTIEFPRSARGTYTFSTLANFLSGTYSGFTQTFGEPRVSQRNPNLGLFAQDEWRAGQRLTLNLGLRYDLQWLDTIATDTNNVSPRIGVAWTPSASRDLVIRGNAGLFFDRVPLRAVANAILSARNTTDLARLHQPGVSNVTPAQAGAPVFPNILPEQLLTTTLVDFTTMDRHLQNAYSRQVSVEAERSLGPGRTITAGYQYLRGDNLLMSINQNVPSCVTAGTNNGCRPNASYRNNNQYSSAGESNYHGLHLSFVQRVASWASLRASYTLSTAKNDVGEAFFNAPIDPGNPMRDWGRADDDQRQRLVIDGTLRTSGDRATTAWARITHGFQIGAMLQYYSALPFNITSGVTSLQGPTGRPLAGGQVAPVNFDVTGVDFIPRNAGAGSDFFSLNMRASRRIPVGGRVSVEALIEAFNVTNRTNVVTRNTNFGPGPYPSQPLSTFDQATAVGDPRTFQIGLRLRF